MKKLICLLLCMVLLFAGCGQTAAAAVDKKLAKGVGQPQKEMMRKLDLSEDNVSEMSPSVYVKELNWCGKPVKTEFGFLEGALFAAIATETLPDNADTEQRMNDCLAMFEEQFNAPYSYHQVDLSTNENLGTPDVPDTETALAWLAETENGGVSFRYSLSGDNDGTGDTGPYAEIGFTKYKEDPNNIRIAYKVTGLLIRSVESTE